MHYMNPIILLLIIIICIMLVCTCVCSEQFLSSFFWFTGYTVPPPILSHRPNQIASRNTSVI